MSRWFLLPALLLAADPAWAAPQAAPNVIFILADDLGWSDTTINGTTKFYQTPNVQRLAKRGVRFTNAYAASPVCSPTRCSILTGLYPGRVGITSPVCHQPDEREEAKMLAKARPEHKAIQPISANRLPTTHFTLAKAFKAAGYATGHFGKWHLGLEPYDPLHHGFDVDVPHHSGSGPSGGYVGPWKFPPKLNFSGKLGEHIEDRMAQEAVQFIKANKDRPFYLNYWAFSVHSPWDAKKELIEKYRREANPKSAQRNPIYAAMVHSLDEAIGKLLDTLTELKIADNTILVFFSDNGGVHWLDEQMKEKYGFESPPTSNAPLRGGKGTLYEGGTREPCVIVWPGKTRPDTVSEALVSSVDFYPTLLEMAGLTPKAGLHFDGVSQVPALLGKAGPRAAVYCHFPPYTPATGNVPGTWARKGDWKLIRFHHDGPNQEDRFELYDLKDDLGEKTDLAGRFPERVKELDALIARHLQETKTLVPKKNPAFKPKDQ